LRRNITEAVVLTVSDNRLAAGTEIEADSNRAAHRMRTIRGLAAQLDGAATERYSDGMHIEIVIPTQEASK